MKIHNKYWIEKKFTDFKSIFDLTNSKFNNNFQTSLNFCEGGDRNDIDNQFRNSILFR